MLYVVTGIKEIHVVPGREREAYCHGTVSVFLPLSRDGIRGLVFFSWVLLTAMTDEFYYKK